MIQAHELRIGNLLAYNDGSGPEIIRIKEVRERDFVAYLDDQIQRLTQYYNSAYVTLIPLTPEILEACKLIDPETGMLHFGQLFNKETGELFVQWRQAPVKYLHVLQNVYYYQMDEELEVNLPA